jgi:hypothetical protein
MIIKAKERNSYYSFNIVTIADNNKTKETGREKEM